MVVIYFFALVFTLAMATADVSLSKHWKDWDPDTLNAIELQLYNDRDDGLRRCPERVAQRASERKNREDRSHFDT